MEELFRLLDKLSAEDVDVSVELRRDLEALLLEIPDPLEELPRRFEETSPEEDALPAFAGPFLLEFARLAVADFRGLPTGLFVIFGASVDTVEEDTSLLEEDSRDELSFFCECDVVPPVFDVNFSGGLNTGLERLLEDSPEETDLKDAEELSTEAFACLGEA